MPTYPHYRPGDEKPNDKLLILEDTDLDGKADKQIIFADQLHLPLGFELAEEGVYVTQVTNFKLLTDTNGDDKADQSEILLLCHPFKPTPAVLTGFGYHDVTSLSPPCWGLPPWVSRLHNFFPKTMTNLSSNRSCPMIVLLGL